MKMKKGLRRILAAALGAALLSGCAAQKPEAPVETAVVTEAASAAETEAASAEGTETAEESGAGTAQEAEAASVGETEAASAEKAETAEKSGAVTAGETVIRAGGLKGPTTMGLVKLIDDAGKGETQDSYEFTMVTAADELTALIAGGKVDIALLPANVASVLYNKTEGGVRVIDINTLGVLYLVSADSSLTSLDQLAGRTVYLPGKGTTPEYTLRYLLAASGLGENDVTLEFCSEAAEVASILAEKPEAVGLLPQPFVTAALAQNEALSIVLDMTEVWDSVQKEDGAGRLVTGVTIAGTEFLNEHKDLVDRFLTAHEASIAFTGEDPDAAAELIAAQGIVAKAPLAKKALPYCSLKFISGEEMKEALSGYLEVLAGQNIQSVGGALPDDAFYYIP